MLTLLFQEHQWKGDEQGVKEESDDINEKPY
jgi:hypothetical protein